MQSWLSSFQVPLSRLTAVGWTSTAVTMTERLETITVIEALAPARHLPPKQRCSLTNAARVNRTRRVPRRVGDCFFEYPARSRTAGVSIPAPRSRAGASQGKGCNTPATSAASGLSSLPGASVRPGRAVRSIGLVSSAAPSITLVRSDRFVAVAPGGLFDTLLSRSRAFRLGKSRSTGRLTQHWSRRRRCDRERRGSVLAVGVRRLCSPVDLQRPAGLVIEAVERRPKGSLYQRESGGVCANPAND